MMEPVPSFLEVSLSYAATVAEGILLLKMLGTRLYRTYGWFSVYLAVDTLQFVLMMLVLRPNTNAYARVWFVSEPLLWILQILIVLEVYRLVLSGFAGISSLGRWTFIAAVVVAVVVAALTLSPDLSNPSEKFKMLLYIDVVERAILSSVAIFLLLMTAFLVWYPIPLSRNIVVFAMVYAPFFLGKAAALFVRNVAGSDLIRTASTIILAIQCACLLVWLLYLNRRGEERKVIVGHQWRPGDDERLVAQLNAVNRTLLRSARK
jgi:hypothetical protein